MNLNSELDEVPQMDPDYIIIKLSRRPFSSNITIAYEDGSSDYLPHRQARAKLIDLGVKDPDLPLDYIYNFYETTIKLSRRTTGT